MVNHKKLKNCCIFRFGSGNNSLLIFTDSKHNILYSNRDTSYFAHIIQKTILNDNPISIKTNMLNQQKVVYNNSFGTASFNKKHHSRYIRGIEKTETLKTTIKTTESENTLIEVYKNTTLKKPTNKSFSNAYLLNKPVKHLLIKISKGLNLYQSGLMAQLKTIEGKYIKEVIRG